MNPKAFRKSYYTSPGGEPFMFTAEHLPQRGRHGESSRARLFRSHDAGKTWVEEPLRLHWRSVVTGLMTTSWPPETIDSVEVRDGAVQIEFHDREANERLPFNWGAEALWRARLLPSGRWRLERLRYLDYDGADRHFRWQNDYED